MSRIYLNNKIAVVAHQADHDNGPFGHAQQQSTEMIAQIYFIIRAIATTGLSFIIVDCCLVSRFKDLVEMAPQWPW
jgi:hypothetical protein